MKKQVERKHYFGLAYDNKKRFCSYWHQIHEVLSRCPESVLEIGIGNGFVKNYLTNMNLSIMTLDIDPDLHPDIISSVTNIPLSDNSIEIITCCEVLEHLPFEDFGRALREIYRVCKKYAVISLPDVRRVYRIEFRIPKVTIVQKLVPLPYIPQPHHFDGEHHWEIGKRSFPFEKIRKIISESGFEIIEEYRVMEIPYHHFFILGK